MSVQQFWFGILDTTTGKLQKHTDVFEKEIRAIRELYMTRKLTPGLEKATEWRECKLQRKIYFILLEKFTWLEFRHVHDYWTPVFRFHVKIATVDPRGAISATIVNKDGPSQKRLTLFTEKDLVAEYQDFPSNKPRFFVDDAYYRSLTTSHSDHIIRASGDSHGWICYYGAGGDWNPDRSSTAEAFTVALDWLVMHINNFGR